MKTKDFSYSSVHYYARIALREGIRTDYDSLKMFLENNILSSYWHFVSALACKVASFAELSANGFVRMNYIIYN